MVLGWEWGVEIVRMGSWIDRVSRLGIGRLSVVVLDGCSRELVVRDGEVYR